MYACHAMGGIVQALFVSVIFTSLVSAAATTTCYSSALVSPTPLTAFANGVATQNYTKYSDFPDGSGDLVLPFKVGLFAQGHGYNVSMNPREFVTDGTPYSSNTYGSGFWLPCTLGSPKIFAGQPQGIFYSIEGTAPSRTANFEWRVAIEKYPDQTFHYGIQLYEDEKNFFRFKYWNIPQIHRQCDPTVGFYRSHYDDDIGVVRSGTIIKFLPKKEKGYFQRGPGNACKYAGSGP